MTTWNSLEECWAKHIYKDDPNGKMHMGHRLPETVCIALGQTEKQAHRRANFIAELHNMDIRNPAAVRALVEAVRASEYERLPVAVQYALAKLEEEPKS